MRVALDGLFLKRGDGTGRYTRELLRAAARLETGSALARDAEWRLIELSAESADEADLTPQPARLKRARLSPPSYVRRENAAKLWFEQRGLPRAAMDGSSDLLHYPYFAAPLRSPVPVVVTVHDLIPLILPEYRGSSLVRAYMGLQSAAVRRAKVILADSSQSRHDVVRLLGVPRKRVRVVHLGVDPEYRPASEEEAELVRRRYRLPERFVLYSGGLDARKNVERLVLAYARARATLGVTEPLAITGDADRVGPLYRPLPPLVERLGLREHVRFLGFVPQADLPALYGASTLFVYPSRYEGFGLPPLEAMACGVPVASSTGGSLAEIVGDAALTFAPDDEPALAEALARGLADDRLREELREKGLARATAFTWEKTAAETLAAYRDACAS